MYDLPINPDDINRRQTAAHALLAGNLEPDADFEQAEADLRNLVEHDVPQLLVELERRQVNSDEGYVRGLRAAARWLAMFDQDLPDFDRATCQRLAKGVAAVAASAAERLGIDEAGAETAGDRVDGGMGLVAACREGGATR